MYDIMSDATVMPFALRQLSSNDAPAGDLYPRKISIAGDNDLSTMLLRLLIWLVGNAKLSIISQ